MSTNNSTTVANRNFRTREPGSTFTVWTVNGAPVVFCVEVDHQSPAPVADAVPIQPLNYIRPAEIVTARAISVGRITMNVIETYGNKPWDYLNGLFPNSNPYGIGASGNAAPGYNDLADVLYYMQETLTDNQGQSSINLYRVIRTPASFGVPQPWYVTEFMGVRIVDIRENERVNIATMQNNLTIDCMYTRKIDMHFDASTGGQGVAVNGPTPISDTISGGRGFV